MRVLLVCMPFADPARPALGLSLLKACLEARGIACDVAYFNLAYARLLGLDAYRRITEEIPPAALAGEWVFVGAAAGAVEGDRPERFLQGVLEDRWCVQESALESVRRARSSASCFLRSAYESVRWSDYALVGFGSTVAQNVASLGLAELVKESHPEIPIVFGGHNWEGLMGTALLEHHACVDYVCSGEADQALPSLAGALAGEGARAASGIPGVISREGPSRIHRLTLRSSALSALPLPDHRDYFAELRRQGLHDEITPVIPLETSRGCWWAVRRPCGFCGINGERREYATKADDRVLEELQALLEAWPGLHLDVVDSVVPRSFLKQVLPLLTSGGGVSLRIRPDATDEELESIAAAGGSVTCGIESLDSHILELLGKGIAARDNVRLLERCARLGISVDWTLLYGVPGETARDFSRQADLLESLSELQPPRAVMPIQLERWSEYWGRAAVLGFGQVRPAAAYEHVYALDRDALSRIAYFFDHEYRPPLGVTLHVARLRRSVGVWRVQGPSAAIKERGAMPDAHVDEWGRSKIEYMRGLPEEWDKRCKSLEPGREGENVVGVSGSCPVCRHPVSKSTSPVEVVALKADKRGRDVYLFTCNCVFAHPNRPDGVRGCGAQGPFTLAPSANGPVVEAAEATIEQFEADDWVESALRQRLARAREWSTQWSNLLAAIIGFVSVAAIFDADATELKLTGSAWQAYLALTAAALVLAVAAVLSASVSSGLRGVKDVRADVGSRQDKMRGVLKWSGWLLILSKLLAGLGAACLAGALAVRFVA